MVGWKKMVHVRERHRPVMEALCANADALVPSDQRYIIMVYDGPELLQRDLSYQASNATDTDVKNICAAMVQQIDGSG